MTNWITNRGDQHLVNRYAIFLERQRVLRVRRSADGRRLTRVELVNRAADERDEPRAVHEAYELLTHAAGLQPSRSQSPPVQNVRTPTDRTPGQIAIAFARFGARLVADPAKAVDGTDYSIKAEKQGNRNMWGNIA